jgi:hypothetical protein
VLNHLQSGGELGKIRTVVDVGPGCGSWRIFLGPHMPASRWTAVEIHEPYVDRFLLAHHYQQVIVADVRDLDPFPAGDLVIFGDVLEHMPAADALAVWDRARASCWRLVLGIPVRHYPQGEWEGNPHEAHITTWDDHSVRQAFDGIYAGVTNGDTGAYLAEGLAGQ